MPAPVAASADTIPLQNGFLDLPRTRALWNDVYRGPHALIREDGWVDRASTGIPLAYAITGDLLARTLAARGEQGEAVRIAATIDSLDHAARLSEFLGRARVKE
jgi:hypothetical protein